MDGQQGAIERSSESSGGTSGGFNPAQAVAETRASLERAYDRIQSRERGEASRSPVINDAARAKAQAERKAEEADTRAQGLPVYQGGAPATVRDSMNAAFDRAEAREKAAKGRQMPALKEGTPIRAVLEESYDWHKLSAADQKLFRGGHDALAEQRKAAEWFGLTPTEAKTTEIARRLEERDRVQPQLDRLARASGKDPEQVLAWHADWAEAFRRNPELAYHQLGEQLHVQQDHQERQQFAQHQHLQRAQFEVHARAAAAQARTAAVDAAVLSHVQDYARGRPDFDRLEPQMVQALSDGRVRRTGNAAVDLANAYAACGGDYA